LLVLKFIRFFSTFVLVGNKEVLKVEISKPLAEKFRQWVAERYGMRRGALSKAVEDLISRALGEPVGGGVEDIIGIGLSSDYEWRGEDICDALRARNVFNRR